MQFVTPKVFRLGFTNVDWDGLSALLEHVGAPEWETDTDEDAAVLSEVAGRLCYRSFAPGLNPNVTRVREGNEGYIGNILGHRHGSVTEHASVTLAFVDVSRIFTHELVRHRIASYSQESLRFIRLDKLSAYYPEVGFGMETMRALVRSLPKEQRHYSELPDEIFPSEDDRLDAEAGALVQRLHEIFLRSFEAAEKTQRDIAELLRLDHCKDFGIKKKITSAMRRMAPDGLATAIITSANHRTMRDIVQRRTDRHAEEEIRLVYGKVFNMLVSQHPSIYQDAKVTMVDGIEEVVFANERV